MQQPTAPPALARVIALVEYRCDEPLHNLVFDFAIANGPVGQRHHDANDPLGGLWVFVGYPGEVGGEMAQHRRRRKLGQITASA
jgi:hypothetical protein